MTGRRILVDEEVWDALQSKAEPFVDTPNDVLRRILGLEQSSAGTRNLRQVGPVSGDVSSGTRQRIAPGVRTAQSEFRLPILTVLAKTKDGRALCRDVIREGGKMMKGTLKPVDYGLYRSGAIRWENNAHFERLQMVKERLLRRDSARGIWEITQEGRAYLAKHETSK